MAQVRLLAVQRCGDGGRTLEQLTDLRPPGGDDPRQVLQIPHGLGQRLGQPLKLLGQDVDRLGQLRRVDLLVGGCGVGKQSLQVVGHLGVRQSDSLVRDGAGATRPQLDVPRAQQCGGLDRRLRLGAQLHLVAYPQVDQHLGAIEHNAFHLTDVNTRDADVVALLELCGLRELGLIAGVSETDLSVQQHRRDDRGDDAHGDHADPELAAVF
ncbi:Uncharacterised protein [Mycobacteroides abscessus subsp. massiliense]|nr:Uncharacterised protein [Mycobacteroides abscessus subsp. massiliense]